MVVMQATFHILSSSDGGAAIHCKHVTFVQALKDKYIDQEFFDDQFKVPKDQSISTEITYVGFDRVSNVQKQLRRLVSIDLSGRCIKTAGNLSEVFGSLTRVTILNLADNFLTWSEMIKILPYLPNLREIVMSGNDLKAGDIPNYPKEPFKKLISITLGKIGLDWSSIISVLSRIWANIEEVDLWDNHFSIESFQSRLDNTHFVSRINSLRLSQNYFTELKWITCVEPMDCLTELDVSKCGLESINLDEKTLGQLKNLNLLNISHNNIADWSSLSNLNRLQKLQHLICYDNPIFITDKSAKALTVGRISALTRLNREEITPSFRRDSEIFYLRQTFTSLLEKKDINIDRYHPRYSELVETYGIPVDLNERQQVDKYITVELCMNDKLISKKLPCDMRVSNLLMLCKRLFKLKPYVSIEIVCREELKDDSVSYPLDKEGQTLHFFSVKTGHRLIINEID